MCDQTKVKTVIVAPTDCYDDDDDDEFSMYGLYQLAGSVAPYFTCCLAVYAVTLLKGTGRHFILDSDVILSRRPLVF
jgi:hypothetical protein